MQPFGKHATLWQRLRSEQAEGAAQCGAHHMHGSFRVFFMEEIGAGTLHWILGPVELWQHTALAAAQVACMHNFDNIWMIAFNIAIW